MDKKIKVPDYIGPQLVIRYAGADPVTYVVEDGQATVPEEQVKVFLRSIAGAKLVEDGQRVKASSTTNEGAK